MTKCSSDLLFLAVTAENGTQVFGSIVCFVSCQQLTLNQTHAITEQLLVTCFLSF